ncbi:Uncharacterised protein [Mycobacteroides abscessus subsp. abscessus]|nr:Uncharacterised protein [Mycobacteroides abscessus subsp. abscessus]
MATAICPPSNGSSGNRLIAPSAKLSCANRIQNMIHMSCSTVSPPMRLAPTMLIGVSMARSLPVMESHRAPTFIGILPMALTVSTATVPMRFPVAGMAVTGL